MAVELLIPTPLRPMCENAKQVSLDVSGSIDDVMRAFLLKFPLIETHLYDENNQLRKFVNIYLNDTNVRDLDGESSKVSSGDTVSIVPSIAGG